MNPNLDALKPDPFERLTRLKAGVTPPADVAPIALSIAEREATVEAARRIRALIERHY